MNKIIKTIKFIYTYPDRVLFILVCIYSVLKKLEILAVIFLLLSIIGLERFKKFILAILAKIEESEEVSLGGLSLKKVRASPLPKDSIELEEKSGIPLEFYQNFNQGHLFLMQGKTEEAKRLLEKAVQLEPNNFETYVSLGLIYNILKENNKSIEYSRKALEIRPNSFVPQFNLAVATNHLYGATKSLEEYLKAEEIAKEAGMGETVTVGKLNLFVGHDFRDIGQKEETLKRYLKAKQIFETYNTSEAHFWLRDTLNNIKLLENSV